MRQFTAVVVAVVVATTSLAAAGPIREAAEIAATNAAVEAAVEQAQQEQSPARQRSKARTWGGIALIGLGVLIPVQQETCISVFGSSVACVTEMYTPGLAAAVGLVGTGVLLATVWSHVPAQQSMDLTITADRVQLGKTFGW